MARIPAAVGTAAVGATVFAGKGSKIARTVLGVEPDPQAEHPGVVIVVTKRPGYMEACFTLSELWVEASPAEVGHTHHTDCTPRSCATVRSTIHLRSTSLT